MKRHCRACILSSLLLLAGCGDDQSTVPDAGSSEAAKAVVAGNGGKKLFELHCVSCHGAGPGHPGTQRLGERVGEERAALLSRGELPPDYIKLVVREGFKLMPPFRPTEITDSQLDALAAYVTGEKD